MFSETVVRLAVGTIFAAVATFGATGQAWGVEPDFKASPDVYKVLAANDKYRMVEGKWKPGQRDELHSHTGMWFYWATDCTFRSYRADGTINQQYMVSAGEAGQQKALSAHSIENIGPNECRIVMFEEKE